MKAAGAAGTGIEPENAAFFCLRIFVRMAEYHHIHSAEISGNVLLVVYQKEDKSAQGNGAVVGNVLGPFLVIVPADNIERSILFQCVHDALFVDVAAMQDGVNVFQLFRDFGPQKAVCVREDGKFHRASPFQARSVFPPGSTAA